MDRESKRNLINIPEPWNCILSTALSDIRRSRISVYSAQAAFQFIISAVPFFMLLLSLVRYTLPSFIPVDDESLRVMLQQAMPHSLQFYLLRIFDSIYSDTSVRLVSFSAIFALYASSRGIYALMQGLNEIDDTKEDRSLLSLRAIALINTILMLFLLIASLLILVFDDQIAGLIVTYIPRELRLIMEILHLRTLPAILLIICLFMFFYSVLPSKKHRWIRQLPGAVFSAVTWLLYSYIYSLYIDHIASHSIIYGSLGAVVFMMLWLYMCLEIFLFGALINKWTGDYWKRKRN